MSRMSDPSIYVVNGLDNGLKLDVVLYFAHILGETGRSIIRAHCLKEAAAFPEARDLLSFLNDVERAKKEGATRIAKLIGYEEASK